MPAAILKYFDEIGPISDKLLFWTLCGMFFSLPIATGPATVTGILSIVIWIISGKFIRNWKSLKSQIWSYPVLLYILFHWIGLLWTSDLENGIEFARKTYYLVYAFVIAALYFHGHKPELLIKVFLTGLSITAFITVLQGIGIIPIHKVMPTAYIGHITHALFLVFGIVMFSFFYSKSNNRMIKIGLLVLMVLCFLALEIGYGRAGYLAFIVLLPLVAYNLFRKRTVYFIIPFIIISVSALFLSQTVRNRTGSVISDIKTFQKGDPNTSIGWRLHMWTGAIKIFINKPLLGCGTGGFRKEMENYRTPNLSPKFHQNILDPHNIFLYMATSFGLFGLLLMVWYFYLLLTRSWRYRETVLGFSILAFALIVIIGNFSTNVNTATATGQLFGLMTGLLGHLNEN